jgi:hypothetical protein
VVRVAGVFVVVLLAGSACGTTKTKASELTDLRVCGTDAYNSDDSVCTRDEKAAPLTSRTIHCSLASREAERTSASAAASSTKGPCSAGSA